MDVLGVGDVSVRDRYAAAYRLLPPPGRRAMRYLGSQDGRSVTAIGLAAAMSAPVDAAEYILESLVDTGLITRSDVSGRYGISILVSAYAASTQLDAADLTRTLPNAVTARGARVPGDQRVPNALATPGPHMAV